MAESTFETVVDHLTPGLPSPRAGKILLHGLFGRHNEDWRGYHTLEHPLEMFDLTVVYWDDLVDPEAVGWTDFCHDAIFDPKSPPGRNEELSARLAGGELPDVAGERIAKKVVKITLATAGHEVDGDDPDTDFFLDKDLSILGASPERYDRYADGIWVEFVEEAGYPVEQYVEGRIKKLRDLATRVEGKGLFRTELFRELCEAQSQENMARECDSLTSRLADIRSGGQL